MCLCFIEKQLNCAEEGIMDYRSYRELIECYYGLNEFTPDQDETEECLIS